MALIGPNGAGKRLSWIVCWAISFLTAGGARIQGLKPTGQSSQAVGSDFTTGKYGGGGFEGQGTLGVLQAILSK